MKQYEIVSYKTASGETPFRLWLEGLKDNKAKTIIVTRLERAQAGLFGDWKAISESGGVCEMRIHYGQGFRVFYALVGQTVVLLLAGSSKQDQKKAIAMAKANLADFRLRTTP